MTKISNLMNKNLTADQILHIYLYIYININQKIEEISILKHREKKNGKHTKKRA